MIEKSKKFLTLKLFTKTDSITVGAYLGTWSVLFITSCWYSACHLHSLIMLVAGTDLEDQWGYKNFSSLLLLLVISCQSIKLYSNLGSLFLFTSILKSFPLTANPYLYFKKPSTSSLKSDLRIFPSYSFSVNIHPSFEISIWITFCIQLSLWVQKFSEFFFPTRTEVRNSLESR